MGYGRRKRGLTSARTRLFAGPGFNTLQGQKFVSEHADRTYEHFIQIVPTIYKTRSVGEITVYRHAPPTPHATRHTAHRTPRTPHTAHRTPHTAHTAHRTPHTAQQI